MHIEKQYETLKFVRALQCNAVKLMINWFYDTLVPLFFHVEAFASVKGLSP